MPSHHPCSRGEVTAVSAKASAPRITRVAVATTHVISVTMRVERLLIDSGA